jgi:hypothetical protein
VLGQLFDHWEVDGVPRSQGNITCTVQAHANHKLNAIYRAPTCGSFTQYGQSCTHAVPGLRHVATTTRATCGPWINEPVTYGVEFAFLNAFGILLTGTSNTTWNGIPLPLPIPGQPGCSLYTELLATISFGVNGLGTGGTTANQPNDRTLVGAHLFTQCLVVNPLGLVQYSTGIDTLIGGFR